MAIPTVRGTLQAAVGAALVGVSWTGTGKAAGDLCLAWAMTERQPLPTVSASSQIGAADSGWTPFKGVLGTEAGMRYDDGVNFYQYGFWKISTGGEGADVPNTGDSGVINGILNLLVTTGTFDTTTPVEVVGQQTGNLAVTTGIATIPGITPLGADRLYCCGFNLRRDATTTSVNATWVNSNLASPACTGIAGVNTNAGGGMGVAGCYGGRAAATNIGNTTNDTSETTTLAWDALTFFVLPAPAAAAGIPDVVMAPPRL